MSTVSRDPVTDFMAGVEHGERVGAYREVGLRLELEGQARKRIREAVAIERRAARSRALRLAIVTAIVTAIAVYNACVNGFSWPW